MAKIVDNGEKYQMDGFENSETKRVHKSLVIPGEAKTKNEDWMSRAKNLNMLVDGGGWG